MGVGVRFFVICVGKWGKHGVKTPKNHFCLTGWGGGVANRHHKGRKNGEQSGKMGENGGKIQFLQISPNFLHFYPSLRISPHFSPFSPIFPHFPHFPPFFFALGTLWVRLWVHYPPPEPGTSEPCQTSPSPSQSFRDIKCVAHDLRTSSCRPIFKKNAQRMHRAWNVDKGSIQYQMIHLSEIPCTESHMGSYCTKRERPEQE